MNSVKDYRKEVRNFKRENQRQMFMDNFFDFLFMLFGISMITGILLFILDYWSYY
jgi:hypothetical protein